jgi:two-component system, OmpR family, response regulator RegX3
VSSRVLVVDDEPAIREAVGYALTREGFDVRYAGDGSAAIEIARRERLDAIVLDLLLPDISGVEVCRRIRAESTVPILMLTAKDGEVDKVLGLEVGADDYVSKPFSLAELLARVRALLRRRELDRDGSMVGVLRAGGIEVDLLRHEVVVDGRAVPLTRGEFKLLALLASEPERTFTRAQLVRHLWDSEFAGDERACDAHIVNLRRKIEETPSRPARLLTVRGVGYKLVPV